MGYTLKIPGGVISMVNTEFKCPVCKCDHIEDDWFPKYEKSKSSVIYIKCKRCKTKLGVTTNIRCDVVVWEKSTEK